MAQVVVFVDHTVAQLAKEAGSISDCFQNSKFKRTKVRNPNWLVA